MVRRCGFAGPGPGWTARPARRPDRPRSRGSGVRPRAGGRVGWNGGGTPAGQPLRWRGRRQSGRHLRPAGRRGGELGPPPGRARRGRPAVTPVRPRPRGGARRRRLQVPGAVEPAAHRLLRHRDVALGRTAGTAAGVDRLGATRLESGPGLRGRRGRLPRRPLAARRSAHGHSQRAGRPHLRADAAPKHRHPDTAVRRSPRTKASDLGSSCSSSSACARRASP